MSRFVYPVLVPDCDFLRILKAISPGLNQLTICQPSAATLSSTCPRRPPPTLALISLVLRRVVLYKVGGCSRLRGVISLPALRGNINLTRLVRSLLLSPDSNLTPTQCYFICALDFLFFFIKNSTLQPEFEPYFIQTHIQIVNLNYYHGISKVLS